MTTPTIDKVALFNRALELQQDSFWWRGWSDGTEEIPEGQYARCVWLAVSDAYREMMSEEDKWAWASNDPSVVSVTKAAIATIDPRNAHVVDGVADLSSVFDWNDHLATDKEQVEDVLRKAVEMAGSE